MQKWCGQQAVFARSGTDRQQVVLATSCAGTKVVLALGPVGSRSDVQHVLELSSDDTSEPGHESGAGNK